MQIITGACVTAWGASVYQAGSAVVVGSWSGGGDPSQACPAMAVVRYVRATLARPLGSRVVLDVASGDPLEFGGPMRG